MRRARDIHPLWVALIVVSLAGLAWSLDRSRGAGDRASVALEVPPTLAVPKSAPPASEPSAEPKDLPLVGTWRREKHGERVLDVQTDGTARMTVRPAGTWAFLLGERVEVDVRWELQNETLMVSITDGRPESALKAVRRLWGNSWSRTLIECTDRKLVMRDESDGSLEEWQRVEP